MTTHGSAFAVNPVGLTETIGPLHPARPISAGCRTAHLPVDAAREAETAPRRTPWPPDQPPGSRPPRPRLPQWSPVSAVGTSDEYSVRRPPSITTGREGPESFGTALTVTRPALPAGSSSEPQQHEQADEPARPQLDEPGVPPRPAVGPTVRAHRSEAGPRTSILNGLVHISRSFISRNHMAGSHLVRTWGDGLAF